MFYANLRYTTFIGDGDSSSFDAIKNIYGNEHAVRKLDCVGHVHKRMGARLGNWIPNNKFRLRHNTFRASANQRSSNRSGCSIVDLSIVGSVPVYCPHGSSRHPRPRLARCKGSEATRSFDPTVSPGHVADLQNTAC